MAGRREEGLVWFPSAVVDLAAALLGCCQGGDTAGCKVIPSGWLPGVLRGARWHAWQRILNSRRPQ